MTTERASQIAITVHHIMSMSPPQSLIDLPVSASSASASRSLPS